MSLEMKDILLIDKPKGLSSFDVIRALRSKLGIRKMGHAGTLDPLATGLLIVGLNEGTKKLKHYIGLAKTYKAEVLLGKKTDTGDLEGKIVARKEVPELNKFKVTEVLESMVGKLLLPAPIYSALKRGGESLYKKARRGERVRPAQVEMEVISFKLLDLRGRVVGVEWQVGSGTYVRSLAEELGKRLGTVATLQNLRRSRIGPFDIKDAQTLA
jgi:tRNA pseudouridine55 synthase